MGIVTKVQSLAEKWNDTLQKATYHLFGLCLTLTIVMFGVKAALNRNNIAEVAGQFILAMIFCSLVAAVIHNYIPWTKAVIDGMTKLANSAGAQNYDAGSPLQSGFKIVVALWDSIQKMASDLSIMNTSKSIAILGTMLLVGICAIIILIVFALLTAQVIMIKCESYIAIYAAMVLLGLGGADFLKEYAINVMRYVLSVAVKLYTMQLVMSLGLQLFDELVNQVQSVAKPGLAEAFIYIATAIVIFALAKSVPDMVAGIVNGSHSTSGASLTSAVAGFAGAAVGGAVGAVAGGAGVALGGARGSDSLRKATQIAGMEGKSGLGKAASTVGTLYNANNPARFERGKASHSSRLHESMRARHTAAKMNQGDEGSGGSEGQS